MNWVLGGFGPDQRKQLPEFLADGADAAEDIIFTSCQDPGEVQWPVRRRTRT